MACRFETAHNIAEFLGHLKGQRQARGTKPVAERTMLILDEASTTPMADVAAIVRLAAERGCRLLLTGDHEQAAAVHDASGLMMLAKTAGYAQLVEPSA